LIYSTFIGGSNWDQVTGLAIDSGLNVYVTGYTEDGSPDFPTRTGSYDVTYNGGSIDVFVTKFDN
jgi:hypothetical protein